MRSLIFSLLLVANFSGKWVIEQPQTTLILNQVGNEVTGSISARTDSSNASPADTEILDGVVEGDTISFYVWTGADRPVKSFYKGTMSGDEIKFTVTSGPGAPQHLTARRSR